jgi:hypothetical protein
MYSSCSQLLSKNEKQNREAGDGTLIFGRFLMLDGKESAFESALGEVVTLRLRSGQASTRAEAGCVIKEVNS